MEAGLEQETVFNGSVLIIFSSIEGPQKIKI